jgi:hypothetical protein
MHQDAEKRQRWGQRMGLTAAGVPRCSGRWINVEMNVHSGHHAFEADQLLGHAPTHPPVLLEMCCLHPWIRGVRRVNSPETADIPNAATISTARARAILEARAMLWPAIQVKEMRN